jgi:hemerythrin-like domain-containing protein
MTTSIDFRTPTAGYDEPLELWQACHERVLRMVGLLQRLCEHLEREGADEKARVTATSILRYFDEAAPKHHADEEQDLFPRLLQRLRAREDTAAAEKVADEIASLEADHAEMKSIWLALREVLLQIEAGRAGVIDAALAALFATRYRHHVEVEDTKIAPALRRALTDKDLATIGQAMAARRGVAWGTPAAG